MWFAPELLEDPDYYLSDQYRERHLGRRPPIVVCLPGGRVFCVDGKSAGGGGWTVSGDPPRITVTPSINWEGHYHGWLIDGVLSDDCEGRRFT